MTPTGGPYLIRNGPVLLRESESRHGGAFPEDTTPAQHFISNGSTSRVRCLVANDKGTYFTVILWTV